MYLLLIIDQHVVNFMTLRVWVSQCVIVDTKVTANTRWPLVICCIVFLFFSEFSSTRPISFEDLDISVMLSLFRKYLNMRAPTRGWGNIPKTTDTAVADDIEIRRYRNMVCHPNCCEMAT